jgi:UrcA family protein
MSRLLLTTCLLAVTAFASPALAQSNTRLANDPSVRIVVSDLDLSNPADAREYHRRAAKAARTLCRQMSQEPLSAQMTCQRDVIDIAKSDLSQGQRADLASSKKKDAQEFADRSTRGQSS